MAGEVQVMGSHGGRDRSRRESNGMLDVLADGGAGGKMVRLVVMVVMVLVVVMVREVVMVVV